MCSASRPDSRHAPVPSLMAMLERSAPACAGTSPADPAAPAPAPRPVMKPWVYVRLRREAAGLSLEQAARPYWKHEHHRADVERNLARLEQPGVRLRRAFYTADLSRAFPFEVEVYRQLCEAPEESHPRLCLACGWDEWTIQPDTLGQDCTWSATDPLLCTLCEQLGRARAVG